MAETTTIKPISLEYTCFACPPDGINMYKGYSYLKDDEGDYIVCGKEDKIYLDLEVIKMLFTPKDSKWIDILNNKN